MDLDAPMRCCSVLLDKIEILLSGLQIADGTLDLRNRIKLVFGSRNIDHIQRLVEQQTSALTLLLTTCNW